MERENDECLHEGGRKIWTRHFPSLPPSLPPSLLPSFPPSLPPSLPPSFPPSHRDDEGIVPWSKRPPRRPLPVSTHTPPSLPPFPSSFLLFLQVLMPSPPLPPSLPPFPSRPSARKFNQAVAVAGGRLMDAIVTDTKQTAAECIRHLR